MERGSVWESVESVRLLHRDHPRYDVDIAMDSLWAVATRYCRTPDEVVGTVVSECREMNAYNERGGRDLHPITGIIVRFKDGTVRVADVEPTI